MGFRTQRQYTTSIRSYDDVKEAVRRERDQFSKYDLQPEDDKGNFTFYLKKYPDVRTQITSRKHFLKLHGVKPEKFLVDLKIIRELTSLLSERYPRGIDLKLDKETFSWIDQGEIIEESKEVASLEFEMLCMAMTDRKKLDDFIESVWRQIDNDSSLHDDFAEMFNDFFAKVLCKNGFRCKPDGSLKIQTNKPSARAPILRKFIGILLKSGFLLEE